MAMGGIARVSQVQLLQPFVTFALAAFFNDETITLQILLFAAAVVATVAISTRTARQGRASQMPPQQRGSRAASAGGCPDRSAPGCVCHQFSPGLLRDGWREAAPWRFSDDPPSRTA